MSYDKRKNEKEQDLMGLMAHVHHDADVDVIRMVVLLDTCLYIVGLKAHARLKLTHSGVCQKGIVYHIMIIIVVISIKYPSPLSTFVIL